MSKTPKFPKQSEADVTKECTDLLYKRGIIHIRNNVLYGKFKGFKEKKFRIVKTGIRGEGDWMFFLEDGSGRIAFLETKATGEKQSQDQLDFEADCIKRNIPYYCVDHVNELIEILDIYGM